jgi:hypothetical protein
LRYEVWGWLDRAPWAVCPLEVGTVAERTDEDELANPTLAIILALDH